MVVVVILVFVATLLPCFHRFLSVTRFSFSKQLKYGGGGDTFPACLLRHLSLAFAVLHCHAGAVDSAAGAVKFVP